MKRKLRSAVCTVVMVAASLQLEQSCVAAGRSLVAACRPRVTLSMREFAEKRVRPATGQYPKQRFRISRQPWTGLFFDELDGGRWNTVVCTGPSQSGKTLAMHVIPTLHVIAELHENLVLGPPDEDMADKKWKTDLLPVMQASPSLRGLIPVTGPGSRGGKVRDQIEFENGVMAAIMTPGSSDQGKAGFTSRFANLTEGAAWGRRTEGSSESMSYKQVMARLRAFHRSQRRMIIEGTTTTSDELPWLLMGEDVDRLISSKSRIVSPCPHCESFIAPEREHFVGWQDAETQDEACNEASFVCPDCGVLLSEDDRKASNQDLRLVHAGQSVDAKGDVVGESPPVSTLWFRYSQWHNMLLEYGDLALDEWTAQQHPQDTEARDNAEMELCQFQWCYPYKAPSLAEVELTREQVRAKYSRPDGDLPLGVLPESAEVVGTGIDCRQTQLHFVAWSAGRSGEAWDVHRVDLGVWPVRSAELGPSVALITALRELRERFDKRGWRDSSGRKLTPHWSLVDGGWKTDIVRQFIRESPEHWMMSFGRGQSQPANRGGYSHPTKLSADTQWIGDQCHVKLHRDHLVRAMFVNADHWKTALREGLATPHGASGCITLCKCETADQRQLDQQFDSQVRSERAEWVKLPTKPRPVLVYTNETGKVNHFLDAGSLGLVSLNLSGVRLAALGDVKEASLAGHTKKPIRTPTGQAFLATQR